MNALDEIKRKIQILYQTNSNIHVDVNMSKPKVSIINQEARIKGVYSHIFQIESNGECYSLRYSELLTPAIRINELENENNLRILQQ
ncbi:MAG: hypothetical protein K6B40_03675 [Firmicutes bacterium]|nr:hypothetical protein [Bacillota bacterium]